MRHKLTRRQSGWPERSLWDFLDKAANSSWYTEAGGGGEGAKDRDTVLGADGSGPEFPLCP